MDIKVVVAAHKPCTVPMDMLYLPLHVGAKGKPSIGFDGDDTGDNLSDKNDRFCELTGLYWAWKNLPNEYIGLVHYRRYFSYNRWKRISMRRMQAMLTYPQAEQLLTGKDGLLPQPRRYWIESLYSHYQHTCHIEPLDITGEILKEKYPDYVPAFERLKKRTSAHMFNMFILRRDHLDAYCTWLFDILFELEKRVDASQYSPFHARFFGRIGELLLDVWLEQNRLDCVTAPVINTEHVNWIKKGTAFLAAKFAGKKYEESF